MYQNFLFDKAKRLMFIIIKASVCRSPHQPHRVSFENFITWVMQNMRSFNGKLYNGFPSLTLRWLLMTVITSGRGWMPLLQKASCFLQTLKQKHKHTHEFVWQMMLFDILFSHVCLPLLPFSHVIIQTWHQPKATECKKLVFLLLSAHSLIPSRPRKMKKISFRGTRDDKPNCRCRCGLRLQSHILTRMLLLFLCLHILLKHLPEHKKWYYFALSFPVPLLRIYGFPNVYVYVFTLSTFIPSEYQEYALSLSLHLSLSVSSRLMTSITKI